MSEKLSATRIANLKPKATDYDCFDSIVNGLTVRVRPSGAKSFTVFYRNRGKSKLHRRTLGSAGRELNGVWVAGKFTLEAARERAREILIAASAGAATGGDERTFGAVATRYMREYTPHKRSGREDDRMLEKDVIPAWDRRPIDSITLADVSALLDTIKARAPIAANRVRAVLSKLFNFAMKKGIAKANPVTLTDRSKEYVKDRWLSRDELRQLWASLDAEPAHVSAVFRLILLTGTRKREASKLKQAEITGTDWTLPPSRSKNGRALLIPLSPYALSLAKQIGRGFNEQVAFDRIRDRAGIPDITIHTLRSTFTSYMAELEIAPPHVTERLLNHAQSSVMDRHYQKYDFRREKAAALSAWEAALLEIVGEQPVRDLASECFGLD